VEALETIGAPETAAICERAKVAAFPAGLPASEDAIRSAAGDLGIPVKVNIDSGGKPNGIPERR
jgi:hypothetical protein